jgi:hypothetical protein
MNRTIAALIGLLLLVTTAAASPAGYWEFFDSEVARLADSTTQYRGEVNTRYGVESTAIQMVEATLWESSIPLLVSFNGASVWEDQDQDEQGEPIPRVVRSYPFSPWDALPIFDCLVDEEGAKCVDESDSKQEEQSGMWNYVRRNDEHLLQMYTWFMEIALPRIDLPVLDLEEAYTYLGTSTRFRSRLFRGAEDEIPVDCELEEVNNGSWKWKCKSTKRMSRLQYLATAYARGLAEFARSRTSTSNWAKFVQLGCTAEDRSAAIEEEIFDAAAHAQECAETENPSCVERVTAWYKKKHELEAQKSGCSDLVGDYKDDGHPHPFNYVEAKWAELDAYWPAATLRFRVYTLLTLRTASVERGATTSHLKAVCQELDRKTKGMERLARIMYKKRLGCK